MAGVAADATLSSHGGTERAEVVLLAPRADKDTLSGIAGLENVDVRLQHRKWKKRLAWWLYARADLLGAVAIHATAELEAGFVRAVLGAKCPPVIVVPNGVADLIRAFGALGLDGWELVIAGNDDGGHERVCRALAAQQPNADRIWRFLKNKPVPRMLSRFPWMPGLSRPTVSPATIRRSCQPVAEQLFGA